MTPTREQVIQLANDAGWYEDQDFDGSRFKAIPQSCWERFAALAFAAGQQAEREKLEQVAWLNPYGGALTQLTTGLERKTFTIPLYRIREEQ